jgi:hypothetical protein
MKEIVFYYILAFYRKETFTIEFYLTYVTNNFFFTNFNKFLEKNIWDKSELEKNHLNVLKTWK